MMVTACSRLGRARPPDPRPSCRSGRQDAPSKTYGQLTNGACGRSVGLWSFLRRSGAMDLGLRGKVAIVAASSKGMGKAIAMGRAAEGSRVTMLARTTADLERAPQEVRETCHADVLAVPANVTRSEDVKRIVHETVARWGTVDILVNNAGGTHPGVFDEVDDAKWQSAFELHLLSTVGLVREVLPYMRKAGGGAIINLQSTSVKIP